MQLDGSLIALLGVAAWFLLLGAAVVACRGWMVLRGERRSNEFPAMEEHGTARYWRLCRAHLNTAENLPAFATIVLTGHVAGVAAGDAAFGWWALAFLAARICQSAVHVLSGAAFAVNFRVSFLLIQYLAAVVLIVRILQATGAF